MVVALIAVVIGVKEVIKEIMVIANLRVQAKHNGELENNNKRKNS